MAPLFAMIAGQQKTEDADMIAKGIRAPALALALAGLVPGTAAEAAEMSGSGSGTVTHVPVSSACCPTATPWCGNMSRAS